MAAYHLCRNVLWSSGSVCILRCTPSHTHLCMHAYERACACVREALASLQHACLDSFFLDPEDIMNLIYGPGVCC